MAAKKNPSRGRPRKPTAAQIEEANRLAAEAAAEHEHEEEGGREEDEPMVVGQYTYEVPLSQVMGRQGEDERPIGKKKPPQSLREKYNAAKAKGLIAEDGLLLMSIFRLPLYTMDGTIGVQAEKEFCFRTRVSVEFLENDDFFPLLQKYGFGAYSIQVRHTKGIMTEFDRHISKPINAAPPQVATDPATGAQTIIYQQSPNGNGAQQPIGVIDPMKQFRDSLKMMKEVKEAFGQDVIATQPQPATAVFDPQRFAAEVMQSKQIMEAIIEGVTGGKSRGSGRKDMTELIFEHAPSIIRELKDAAREIMQDVRHGQAQQNQITGAQDQPLPLASQNAQHIGGADAVAGEQGRLTNASANHSQAQAMVTPEMQLLSYTLEACAVNARPADIAVDIYNFLDSQKARNPLDKTALLVEQFKAMEPQAALTMLAQIAPEAEAVTKMPHSLEWVKTLQEALKEEEEE